MENRLHIIESDDSLCTSANSRPGGNNYILILTLDLTADFHSIQDRDKTQVFLVLQASYTKCIRRFNIPDLIAQEHVVILLTMT